MPQPEQRSDEWYVFRKSRLTASDLGTALGENPYSKPEDLILKKCGIEAPFKPNKACMHGIKDEDVTIQIYESRYKKKIIEFGCIEHPNY